MSPENKVILGVGSVLAIIGFGVSAGAGFQLNGWVIFFWSVALILGGYVLVMYLKTRRRDESKNQPQSNQQELTLSTSEASMVLKTNLAFGNLSWAHKIALRSVYSDPGMKTQAWIDYLTELGFRDPDANIIWPLSKTNLISFDSTGHVHTSQYPIIVKEVRKLLETPL